MAWNMALKLMKSISKNSRPPTSSASRSSMLAPPSCHQNKPLSTATTTTSIILWMDRAEKRRVLTDRMVRYLTWSSHDAPRFPSSASSPAARASALGPGTSSPPSSLPLLVARMLAPGPEGMPAAAFDSSRSRSVAATASTAAFPRSVACTPSSCRPILLPRNSSTSCCITLLLSSPLLPGRSPHARSSKWSAVDTPKGTGAPCSPNQWAAAWASP
mmetsp:Transcript_28218/g.61951  ORF Transcript_28218/g.61951 Transcript_28218/m.61951 type:complete len:216 (-) Transcript_28218:1206-1853(-)